MEISSVSSNRYYINSATKNMSLTDDQKAIIEKIISQFDSENMTSDEYKKLTILLKDAGIKMSPEVEKMLEEKGLKVPAKSSLLTQIKNSRSPSLLDYLGSYDNNKESLQVSSKVSEIISRYQSGEITEDDLINGLKSVSGSKSRVGGLVDLEA